MDPELLISAIGNKEPKRIMPNEGVNSPNRAKARKSSEEHMVQRSGANKGLFEHVSPNANKESSKHTDARGNKGRPMCARSRTNIIKSNCIMP